MSFIVHLSRVLSVKRNHSL